MKKLKIIFSFFVLLTSIFLSCEEEENLKIDVFNTKSDVRNLVVVISDLHLGADLSYAEININLDPLKSFLEQIRISRSVKELVLNGDIIDEWFIPASVNPYNGNDQSHFIDRVANSNSNVVTKIRQIIQEGKILVTYIPGNHDLTITSDNVNRLFPGINQSRDADAQGLGNYSPSGLNLMAIEHGHRYNFFCAPDPFSNQDVAPGTILPPGYFLTRIAVQHVIENCTQNIDIINPVTPNVSGGESQALLYGYWSAWSRWLTQFPINHSFNEKLCITHTNGFNDTCSVNDLVPYQNTPGGLIQLNYYNEIQDHWAERCMANNVPVPFSTGLALAFASSPSGTDTMSVIEYFQNPISNKRIVIFGHSHSAKIRSNLNYNQQKTIYANTGTWIDHNLNSQSMMNFIVITPQTINYASQTHVDLYNYENKVVTLMAKDSVRL